jgi:hypothetical protein
MQPKYISSECKRRRHRHCEGYVLRGYDEPHDHDCDCDCHKPQREE